MASWRLPPAAAESATVAQLSPAHAHPGCRGCNRCTARPPAIRNPSSARSIRGRQVYRPDQVLSCHFTALCNPQARLKGQEKQEISAGGAVLSHSISRHYHGTSWSHQAPQALVRHDSPFCPPTNLTESRPPQTPPVDLTKVAHNSLPFWSVVEGHDSTALDTEIERMYIFGQDRLLHGLIKIKMKAGRRLTQVFAEEASALICVQALSGQGLIGGGWTPHTTEWDVIELRCSRGA